MMESGNYARTVTRFDPFQTRKVIQRFIVRLTLPAGTAGTLETRAIAPDSVRTIRQTEPIPT
jgi:hypothetical protein